MTTFDTPTRPAGRRGGRHPINIGHFVMGVAFVGIVVVWILISSDAVTGDDVRWLLPVPWVLAGVAGLTATAVTGTRRHSVRRTGWVGTTPDATAPNTTSATAPTADTPADEDPQQDR